MESPASRRFLERQGLLHAQLDGGAAPGGIGSRVGGGAFDESKVKRDGKGQFAKQASKKYDFKDPSEFDSLEEFDAYMHDFMVGIYGKRAETDTIEEFVKGISKDKREQELNNLLGLVRAGLEVRNKVEDRLAGVKHFDAEDFNAVGHMIRQTLNDMGHTAAGLWLI